MYSLILNWRECALWTIAAPLLIPFFLFMLPVIFLGAFFTDYLTPKIKSWTGVIKEETQNFRWWREYRHANGQWRQEDART